MVKEVIGGNQSQRNGFTFSSESSEAGPQSFCLLPTEIVLVPSWLCLLHCDKPFPIDQQYHDPSGT